MSKVPDVRLRYFSSHHFARDVLVGTTTTTFFIALYLICWPALLIDLLSRERIVSLLIGSPWLFVVALPLYTVLASSLGLIANSAFMNARALVAMSKRLQETLGYPRLYRQRAAEIDLLYERFFEGWPSLSTSDILSPTDKIDRLSMLMRQSNEAGYISVYRLYSLISGYRQAIVYSTLLLILALLGSKLLLASIFFLQVPFFYLALHRAIKLAGALYGA